MKLYNPNRLSVIFLVPVAAVAAGEGGCSSTPEPGPLTAEQTVEVVSGNTFQVPNEERYAYADEDGGLHGSNLDSGGLEGQWRIDDRGQLCAFWTEVENGAERCASLRYVGENKYLWQGANLVILEGNPQDL